MRTGFIIILCLVCFCFALQAQAKVSLTVNVTTKGTGLSGRNYAPRNSLLLQDQPSFTSISIQWIPD